MVWEENTYCLSYTFKKEVIAGGGHICLRQPQNIDPGVS